METTSEPAYTEELVTDLDIIYVGGLRDTITLHATDTMMISEDEIVLTLTRADNAIEHHYISRDKILCRRVCEHILRRAVLDPKAQAVPTLPTPIRDLRVRPFAPDATGLRGQFARSSPGSSVPRTPAPLRKSEDPDGSPA
jgi:hypothetical protein